MKTLIGLALMLAVWLAPRPASAEDWFPYGAEMTIIDNQTVTAGTDLLDTAVVALVASAPIGDYRLDRASFRWYVTKHPAAAADSTTYLVLKGIKNGRLFHLVNVGTSLDSFRVNLTYPAAIDTSTGRGAAFDTFGTFDSLQVRIVARCVSYPSRGVYLTAQRWRIR